MSGALRHGGSSQAKACATSELLRSATAPSRSRLCGFFQGGIEEYRRLAGGWTGWKASPQAGLPAPQGVPGAGVFTGVVV